MRYWLQTRAPAGNWVDSIGCGTPDACESHGRYLRAHGQAVRVIERTDRALPIDWGQQVLTCGPL